MAYSYNFHDISSLFCAYKKMVLDDTCILDRILGSFWVVCVFSVIFFFYYVRLDAPDRIQVTN